MTLATTFIFDTGHLFLENYELGTSIHLIGSFSRFVCFSAMNLLISTAEGADYDFYTLHDCKGYSLLTLAGVTADRTQFANARQ